MTWDDIEDILFDGTQDEIKNIKCPECNGHLLYEYFEDTKSLEIKCANCGVIMRCYGCGYVPNFAILEK